MSALSPTARFAPAIIALLTLSARRPLPAGMTLEPNSAPEMEPRGLLLLEAAKRRDVILRDVDDSETARLGRVPVADGGAESYGVHPGFSEARPFRPAPARRPLAGG